jgi:predicted NAD-dependent protein-ADP-ribosyltransferase YbiA (DUF1768 family)
MVSKLFVALCAFNCSFFAVASDRGNYPVEWFAEVSRDTAASCEVLPQDAAPGEVILSNRTTLGQLSKYAHTPFELDGQRYESLEGFLQMLKYPESDTDHRSAIPGIIWPHSRAQVAKMVGFAAKDAGKYASDVMNKMDISWVTYLGRQIEFSTLQKGEAYQLITRAVWAKIEDNPEAKHLLMQTGDLVLRPDHDQGSEISAALKYYEILMDVRKQIKMKMVQAGL